MWAVARVKYYELQEYLFFMLGVFEVLFPCGGYRVLGWIFSREKKKSSLGFAPGIRLFLIQIG